MGVSGLMMKANKSFSVQIDNVVLGPVGADTTFSVQTFYIPPGVTVLDPLADASTIRDKALNVPGFFMSGKLTVVQSWIIPNTSIALPSFVSDPLNPRTMYPSTAVLGFACTLSPIRLHAATGRVDQPARTQLVITVNSTEYLFGSIGDVVSGFSVSPPLGKIVSVIASNTSGQLTVEMQSYMSQFVNLTISTVTVSVPVIPVKGGTRSAWKIDLYVNETLLNTNDAESLVPSNASTVPVNTLNEHAIALSVITVGTITPNINIDCALTVNGSLLPDGTNQIKIVAPSAYKIFISTSETSGIVVTSGGSNLLTATKSGPFGGMTFTILIRARTPMVESQGEPQWVAMVYSSIGMQGWGQIESVPVSPMPLVNYIYGQTSGVSESTIVVDLYIRPNISVASLEIFPPPGLVLACDESHTVSFINCTAPSNNQAGLTLNRSTASMSVGKYSIPLLVSLPLSTPRINTFDIIARNRVGHNVDGFYSFPGREIIDSTILAVVDPSVVMSSTVALSVATVNVSFTTAASTTAVDAVHVVFPPGYSQRIENPFLQVKCVNRKFPRRSVMDWLYTNATNSITFLVDDTVTNIIDRSTGRVISLNKIPGGNTYSFVFPVVLPDTTPAADNFWTLSFCASRYDLDSCASVTSSTAISQFPIIGDIISA
jgi:hypothetical protein